MRKGQIVAIEFLDHVQDASRPMTFIVYGRVGLVTRQAVCVDSWVGVDKLSSEPDNRTRFTIVRSAIKKVTILTARGTK